MSDWLLPHFAISDMSQGGVIPSFIYRAQDKPRYIVGWLYQALLMLMILSLGSCCHRLRLHELHPHLCAVRQPLPLKDGSDHACPQGFVSSVKSIVRGRASWTTEAAMSGPLRKRSTMVCPAALNSCESCLHAWNQKMRVMMHHFFLTQCNQDQAMGSGRLM